MTPVEEAIAALATAEWHVAVRAQELAERHEAAREATAALVKVRQALSRLRANGEGWRPISEHDGSARTVDLWMSLGWRVTNAYWAEYDDDEGVGHTWLTEDGGWIEGEDCRATHFKPLPDPPK